MATEVTALLWPVSVLGLIPELDEKIRMVASEEAVSTTCISGANIQLVRSRLTVAEFVNHSPAR